MRCLQWIQTSTSIVATKESRFPLFARHGVKNGSSPAYPNSPICVYSVSAVKRITNYSLSCPHEIPETLEDPDPAVLRSHRTWLYHRERGQRCQRHRHILSGRRAVRLQAAMDHDSGHSGAD